MPSISVGLSLEIDCLMRNLKPVPISDAGHICAFLKIGPALGMGMGLCWEEGFFQDNWFYFRFGFVLLYCSVSCTYTYMYIYI